MLRLLFSDGSDLQGITRVQDIKYMRYLRSMLQYIASWPGMVDEHSVLNSWRYKYLLLSLNSFCLTGSILYIRYNFHMLSFFEMGETYITTFMSSICVTRNLILLTKKYNEMFKIFIDEIHLFNHRNKSDYWMKIHIYIHKLSHFFTVYMFLAMIMGMTLFNVTPLLNTINAGGFQIPPPENVTYEVSIYFQLPFDYRHNFAGYTIVAVFDVIVCYLASSNFCIFDLYLSLIMFHLWGHLKILIYELENFPRPRTGEYDEEEMNAVFWKLREIVEHHNMIIRFTTEISSTFGPCIAAVYAFYQISVCLMLLECSQLDPKALVRFGPLTLIILQLLTQMSAVFELVSAMRERLIVAVYCVPWQLVRPGERRAVTLMLLQAQRPLGLKAAGMVEVGMGTMLAILKTSISYFAMLQTMATLD